jgi:hypothetical protein
MSSYAPSVPADVEPPELGRLLDFAERPRVDDWSLRAALVRYAQPQPQRVNDVLDLVRRIEWALGKQKSIIEHQGGELWQELQSGTTDSGSPDVDFVVGVLRAAQAIDDLGDILAAWAVDISTARPDADVDRVLADVADRLEALGVPHEERPPQSRRPTRG